MQETKRQMPLSAQISEADAMLISLLAAKESPLELEQFCRRLLQKSPDAPMALNGLGAALLKQGKNSVPYFRRSLALMGEDGGAHANVGNALLQQGDPHGAMESYRRAMALLPDEVPIQVALADVLLLLHQSGEALEILDKALVLEPNNANVLMGLARARRGQGQREAALHAMQRAVQLAPERPDAHGMLGDCLRDMQQHDAAIESYRRAVALSPLNANLYTGLYFSLDRAASVDPKTMVREVRRFSEVFELPMKPHWPKHANARDPNRRLRVGFVSGDLQRHPVANFLEPVLEYLCSSPQLTMFAYSNHPNEDGTTHRLKSYFTVWHGVAARSDDEVAALIAQDGIDILIDLSGHTAFNRLLTFARKPAPVQASWIGYPGSTGLIAMDYYLADRHFLPAGQFDDQFSEKLVQMPASAPFLPSAESPEINTLPALRNGYLTLGSFNVMSKLSRAVVALWSQLLRALPQARMVLGAVPPDGQDTLKAWFAEESIDAGRLRFHATVPMAQFLALHHDVDFCLDTFPYNGGTTSWHGLWMGVPTLTLTGETASGRSGASILGHMQLPDFVAHSKEQFVAQGVQWASRLEELAQIRAGLRERVLASPAGQPQLIAASVEQALRTMWRTWCAGEPARSFEVRQDDPAIAANIQGYARQQAPTQADINGLVALFNGGNLAALETGAQALVERCPNSGIAWKALGIAQQGQGKECTQALQRAAKLLPQDAEVLSNLGFCLFTAGEMERAIEYLERALVIAPQFFPAMGNLGLCYLSQARPNQAAALFQKAVTIQPAFTPGHVGLGIALRDSARADEALLSLKQAIQQAAGFPDAISNYLRAAQSVEAHAPADSLAFARLFSDVFEAPVKAQWPTHRNFKNANRRLRVGFVSGDLKSHPMASFVEPLLERLSSSTQLSLLAYSNVASEDNTSERLKAYFEAWHPVAALPDAALAALIEQDGIDILIDLSGHALFNRLPVFARKPAPVQLSWMGYLGTTGLDAMDYYLGDGYLLPPGQFDNQFTEKLVQLPVTAPFLPAPSAPDVNTLPALRNGYLTLGSFSAMGKLSRTVVAGWAQLLRALPQARMVVGAVPKDGEPTLVQWFAEEGIAANRLRFYPALGMADYLALYHQVDLCLDSFPNNGGANTLHAAWMGVPTLTVAGQTPAGRQGACAMGHLGLTADFVVPSKDALVTQAVHWSKHLQELSQLRAGLRERMRASALGQPEAVAAALERALRTMWQAWCEGQPAKGFELKSE